MYATMDHPISTARTGWRPPGPAVIIAPMETPRETSNVAPDRGYLAAARAIRWLLDHAPEQPSLARSARAAGRSAFHFERSFGRWAGSPKRFLQFLTRERAKRALRGSADGGRVLRFEGRWTSIRARVLHFSPPAIPSRYPDPACLRRLAASPATLHSG